MNATERARIARRQSAAATTLAVVTAKTECPACQRFEARLAKARADGDQAEASRVLVLWRDHDARAGHVKRRA
jgi:hypothetical protein